MNRHYKISPGKLGVRSLLTVLLPAMFLIGQLLSVAAPASASPRATTAPGSLAASFGGADLYQVKAPNTATSTSTRTPTATPTPSQPTILSMAVSPLVAIPNGQLVFTYTVFSPRFFLVALKAAIRPTGSCCWTYDPSNDRSLGITSGTNVITRTYHLAANASGPQDAMWELWSFNSGTRV